MLSQMSVRCRDHSIFIPISWYVPHTNEDLSFFDVVLQSIPYIQSHEMLPGYPCVSVSVIETSAPLSMRSSWSSIYDNVLRSEHHHESIAFYNIDPTLQVEIPQIHADQISESLATLAPVTYHPLRMALRRPIPLVIPHPDNSQMNSERSFDTNTTQCKSKSKRFYEMASWYLWRGAPRDLGESLAVAPDLAGRPAGTTGRFGITDR